MMPNQSPSNRVLHWTFFIKQNLNVENIWQSQGLPGVSATPFSGGLVIKVDTGC